MASKLWDTVSASVGGQTLWDAHANALNVRKAVILPPDYQPTAPAPQFADTPPAQAPIVDPMAMEKVPERTFGQQIMRPFSGVGEGILQFAKSGVDAVSPGSELSTGIGDVIQSTRDARGEAFAAEERNRAREMAQQTTEGGRFVTGAKQMLTSPDAIFSGVGQLAPTMASGLLGLGARGLMAVQAGLGAIQGAGAVRGGVYDKVMNLKDADLAQAPKYQDLIKAGSMPTDARQALAQEAASLSNAGDLVALGAIMGAASSLIGAEHAITQIATKQVVPKITGKAILKAGAVESVTESPQEGTETALGNIGAARTGANVAIGEGVSAAAGGGAALGGVLGGGVKAGQALQQRATAAPSPVPSASPVALGEAPQLSAAQQRAAAAYKAIWAARETTDGDVIEAAREALLDRFADAGDAMRVLNSIEDDADAQSTGSPTDTAAADVSADDTTATGGAAPSDTAAPAATAGPDSEAGRVLAAAGFIGDTESSSTGGVPVAGDPDAAGRGDTAGSAVPGAAGAVSGDAGVSQDTGSQDSDPAGKGAAGADVSGEPKLPPDLAGAKPRYSYGIKKIQLNFASDIDRAAYITAQAKPSARDADYMQFVQDATGMTPEQVRAHGAEVRAAIKAMAKATKSNTLNVLPIQHPDAQAIDDTNLPGTMAVMPTPAEVAAAAADMGLPVLPAQGPKTEPTAEPAAPTAAPRSEATQRAVTRINKAYDDGAIDTAEQMALTEHADTDPLAAVKALNETVRSNLGGDAKRYQATAGVAPRTWVDVAANGSAAETLAALAADTNADPVHRDLAAKLVPLLANTTIEVVPELTMPDGSKALGAVTVRGDRIFLSAAGGLNPETLLHEAVHAATEAVLAMPAAQRTTAQNLAVQQLKSLHRQIVKDAGITALSPEGRQSLHEFIAEVRTKPDLLAQLDATPDSMWAKVKAAILRLIGATLKSAKAMSAVDAIFAVPVPGEATAVRNQAAGDVTATPAFKQWFGDSKVVDADGKPLVVYHGTVADVAVFDATSRKSPLQQLATKLGIGRHKGMFFFASDPVFAGAYAGNNGRRAGGNVIPVFLHMRNPLEWERGAANGSLASALAKAAIEGYDGVIAKNWDESWLRDAIGGRVPPTDVYIVLDNRQIKSAIGNNGQFDPTNPDIRYSAAPKPAVQAPPAPTDPVHEQSNGDKLARAFIDTANNMMLSLDKWAFGRDGGVDGPLVQLKLDFESAFYRARNQKQQFLRELSEQLTKPLIERVRAVAAESGISVDVTMDEANKVAVARRVIDDSNAIAANLKSDADVIAAQLALSAVLNKFGTPKLDTPDTELIRSMVERLRSERDAGRFTTRAKVNRTVAEAEAALFAVHASLNARPQLASMDLMNALDLPRINSMGAAAGDTASHVRDMLAARLEAVLDLFNVRVSRSDRALAIKARDDVARKALSDWIAVQRRPDPFTQEANIEVKLPAGMTIAEAEALLHANDARPHGTKITDLADQLVANFQQINEFAVKHGVVSVSAVSQVQSKRPQYVSFASNPSLDGDESVLHNSRAYMDRAEGTTEYMHGGKLNVFGTMQAKLVQAAHMAAIGERNMRALELADNSAPGFSRTGPQTPHDERIQVLDALGRKVYVKLSDKHYTREAFFNFDRDEGIWGDVHRHATGRWASLLTHYTLMFPIINAFKDAGTRAFNAMGADFRRSAGIGSDAAVGRRLASNVASLDVWEAALAYALKKPLPGQFRAFEEAGGLLTFAQDLAFTSNAIASKFAVPSGKRMAWDKFTGLFDSWNEFFQAVPALAMYKTLAEAGANPAAAAGAVLQQADLGRSGKATKFMRPLYAFFNPAAQELLQSKRTMVDSRGVVNYKAVGVGLGLAVLMGSLYAFARAQDEDDPIDPTRKQMDALPDAAVMASLHVPLPGGGYFKVPFGFGWLQTFMGAGVMAQRAATGITQPATAAAETLALLVKPAFLTGEPQASWAKEPFWNALQTVTPDLAVGIAQVAANKSVFGSRIHFARTDNGQYQSAQGQAKTPEFYKELATGLRETLGVDLPPEVFRSLMETYFVGPLSILPSSIAASARGAKGLEARGATGFEKATGVARLFTNPTDLQVVERQFYAKYERGQEALRKIDAAGLKAPRGAYPMAYRNMGITAGLSPEDAELAMRVKAFDAKRASIERLMRPMRDRDLPAFVAARQKMMDNAQAEFLRQLRSADK